MVSVKSYIRCMKLESSLIVASSIFLGMVLARGSLRIPIMEFLILYSIGGIGISSGSQALNMYFDRRLDEIGHPGRPLPLGEVKARKVLGLAILLLVLPSFSFLFKREVFYLYLLGTTMGVLYSIPPLSLGRRWYTSYPLGSIGYVSLPMLAGWILFSGLSSQILKVVFFFTMLSIFLSPLKDLGETKSDRAWGKSTLPVKVGVKTTWMISSAGVSLVILSFPLLGIRGIEWFVSYLVFMATLFIPSIFFSERLLKRGVFELVRVWAFLAQVFFAVWWIYVSPILP